MRDAVLRSIRERALLRAGDRVVVAVSGGADSIALLRVLRELRPELGIVLAVAHFNHGLRGEESAADEAFVAAVAGQLGLECFAGRGDVRNHALASKLGVEAAARQLRYGWLTQLAAEQRFDVVATAHTLDDQAETVLLKFLRGAGTRGLAGIYPVMKFAGEQDAPGAIAPPPDQPIHGISESAPHQDREALQDSASFGDNVEKAALRIRIVRPLLDVSRSHVEAYLAGLGQQWREDESNLDRRFTRNRVRHDLLPLLEREYNPNIRSVLGDMAEMSRAEEEYWQDRVEQEFSQRSLPVESCHPGVLQPEAAPAGAGRLDLEGFARLPLALQRRLVRRFAAAENLALDFQHVEQLRRCALGKLIKTELPGGWTAVPVKGWLELRMLSRQAEAAYRYVLPVPGEVSIPELMVTLRAQIIHEELAREKAGSDVLSPELMGVGLVVRNWYPGDRFWPAHRGSEEKLKRLFAEKHIPADERLSWPVVLHEAEIVWVRGLPVARSYLWKGEGDAVVIEVVCP